MTTAAKTNASPVAASVLSPPGLRYDRVSIALHWLVALGIAATYGLGLLQEDGPGRCGRGSKTCT